MYSFRHTNLTESLCWSADSLPGIPIQTHKHIIWGQDVGCLSWHPRGLNTQQEEERIKRERDACQQVNEERK